MAICRSNSALVLKNPGSWRKHAISAAQGVLRLTGRLGPCTKTVEAIWRAYRSTTIPSVRRHLWGTPPGLRLTSRSASLRSSSSVSKTSTSEPVPRTQFGRMRQNGIQRDGVVAQARSQSPSHHDPPALTPSQPPRQAQRASASAQDSPCSTNGLSAHTKLPRPTPFSTSIFIYLVFSMTTSRIDCLPTTLIPETNSERIFLCAQRQPKTRFALLPDQNPARRRTASTAKGKRALLTRKERGVSDAPPV